MVNQIAFEKIAGVHDNTQDLISYLDTTNDNVYLVIIDYSNLSTNVDDLKQFVSIQIYEVSSQLHLSDLGCSRPPLPIFFSVYLFVVSILAQDDKG
ncbi:hypothetical protein CU097_014208 [Rhizopus azygosporus]|uniref:Uncharacterized protein n=1 Tax=Rhizopus azygosporus TaxID=86630 RepID=A0A367K407_RHIAZ|nr:hypothetical protein CU097_014208 [Rhizopus azygosporus]